MSHSDHQESLSKAMKSTKHKRGLLETSANIKFLLTIDEQRSWNNSIYMKQEYLLQWIYDVEFMIDYNYNS